jgi:hypothetical protein
MTAASEEGPHSHRAIPGALSVEVHPWIKIPSPHDSLDAVAGQILALWQKADDHRLAVAMLLKEARERVEAGEDPLFRSFRIWCHEKLPGRSERDIRRLIAIASAPDPTAAMTESRAKAKHQTRRTARARQKRTYVSPLPMIMSSTMTMRASATSTRSSTRSALTA